MRLRSDCLASKNLVIILVAIALLLLLKGIDSRTEDLNFLRTLLSYSRLECGFKNLDPIQRAKFTFTYSNHLTQGSKRGLNVFSALRSYIQHFLSDLISFFYHPITNSSLKTLWSQSMRKNVEMYFCIEGSLIAKYTQIVCRRRMGPSSASSCTSLKKADSYQTQCCTQLRLPVNRQLKSR